MKRIYLVLFTGLCIAIVACNNNAGESSGNSIAKTKADTLFDEVMDGHNVAMGKMEKLTKAEREVNRLLDSLGKLPAKAQQAATPYKAKLNTLLGDLKNAEHSMDEWMKDFSIDTFSQNLEERVKYLNAEKGKVSQVKNAILDGLQRTDSLLKSRF